MKIKIILLASILVVANFVAIYLLEDNLDRWFRFGSTLIFFLVYLVKLPVRRELFLALLLISICDLSLVFYESPVFRNLVYISRILAYLCIILFLARNLLRLEFNYFSVLVGIFVVSIDVYLIHEMADALPENSQEPLFLSLFYGLGIFSLILVATCFSYFFRFSNKPGFYMLILSFCFVLSDIFYFNAYYLEFEFFYYFDRFTNILGMSALLLFAAEYVNLKSGKEQVDLIKFL